MNLARLRTSTIALLPVVAVLAACGSGSTAASPSSSAPASSASSAASSPAASPTSSAAVDGSKLAADAMAAVKNAQSVHLKGTVDDNGDKLTIDVLMTKGGDAEAVVGNGAQGTVKLRTIGAALYLTGDDAFWKAAGLPPKQMRNKWIKTSKGTKDFEEMVQLTQLSQWAKTLTPEGDITVVPGKDFGGVKTIGLDDGSDAVLYVAADGDHHPLAFVPKKAGDGDLSFSDWNAPVTVKAPPAAQVVKV